MNRNRILLRILLILTFIFAGITGLMYLVMGAMQTQLNDIYTANQSLFPEELFTSIQHILGLPRTFFFVTALFYFLEVAGSILMWNIRKIGFHLYTISRLLLIAVPALFLGRGYIGLGDIMFAALYIFAYWYLMKSLGAWGYKRNDNNEEDLTPIDKDQSSE